MGGRDGGSGRILKDQYLQQPKTRPGKEHKASAKQAHLPGIKKSGSSMLGKIEDMGNVEHTGPFRP